MNEVVAVVIPAETQTKLAQAGSVAEFAAAFEIDSIDMASLGVQEVALLKDQLGSIKTERDNILRPAKETLERVRAFFDPAIKAREQAIDILRSKLGKWDEEQRRRIALENQAREADARRAREAAAAEAARAEAQARAMAEQKRKEAEEAAKAQQAAMASGNTEAAVALAGEAASLEQQARSVLEKGAAQAAQAVIAAAAISVAAEPLDVPKIAGQRVSYRWRAVIDPGLSEEDVKARVVEAIVKEGRKDLLCLLTFDGGQADRMAVMQHEALSIPGMTAQQKPIVATSKK